MTRESTSKPNLNLQETSLSLFLFPNSIILTESQNQFKYFCYIHSELLLKYRVSNMTIHYDILHRSQDLTKALLKAIASKFIMTDHFLGKFRVYVLLKRDGISQFIFLHDVLLMDAIFLPKQKQLMYARALSFKNQLWGFMRFLYTLLSYFEANI